MATHEPLQLLIHAGTHAGKLYGKGESLHVDAATQAWLELNNIAKPKANTPKKSIEESAVALSPVSTVSQPNEKGEV
ncbi:hypothetical protein OO7_01531 [Providencia sneebia DSM 19967]|uniref:DUF7210 domain-containing protein n=1 Tax=Providencia sneebia DSM 19967 TaxID=1141660 RepID=K8WYR2_9GAMM|nr:hypothetical protein OO7_01531 [Providencia sneebia DSM 19967]